MTTADREWSSRSLKRATLFSLLVLVVLVLLLYWFLDRPLAEAARQLQHTPWQLWATRLSLLADGTVVFFLIAAGLATYALHCVRGDQNLHASPWARDLAFVCLAACVAIAFVESVKVVFGRCRPQLLFEQDLYGFGWWSRDYTRNSFPSGHTTRIFALATAVTLLHGKAAAPALLLALLVGASRVLALKHYPSDVLAGAWLGSVVAFWVWFFWNRERGG
jgi:membrane-associated phospholipid phosphatase